MRVESPSSPRERRSVSTVRRSIISMRDSNSIKKDEKYIPHFRRTELFTSGGGTPEGKEGGQYSHVRGRQFILPPSTTKPAGRGGTILSLSWVYEALTIAQISGLSCGFVPINFMYAKTPSGVLGVLCLGFVLLRGAECGARGDQYMPSMPPAGIAGAGVGSLMSVTRASVVSRVDATDAAFCRALLVTLVGSRMPCLIMSQ